MTIFVELFFLFVLLTSSPVISSNEIKVTEDDIMDDEVKIRTIFFQIIDNFHSNIGNTSKLRREIAMQNFIWSLAEQGIKTIHEVVKVTRLNDTEKSIQNFIDAINENFNENTENETSFDNLDKNINNFNNELKFLRQHYNNKEIENNLLTKLIQLGYKDEEDDDHVYEPGKNEVGSGSVVFRRIYQGLKADIKDFPFVAAVQVFGQFYCAGSIIASDLIITAASCLQVAWDNSILRESPSFISVRVGSVHHDSGGKVIPVKELHFNPNFNTSTLYGNLCILRIEEPLVIHDKNTNVKRIRIDQEAKRLPLTVDNVAIIGWGASSQENDEQISDKLSYSVIDVFKFRDCQDIYSKDYVLEDNFCAGFINKGSGACRYDVGDPGLVDGLLTGIVSFGSPKCGAEGAPTVFTKLGFYKSWIENIMESSEMRKELSAIEIEPNLRSEMQNTDLQIPTPLLTAAVESALKIYFDYDDNLYNAFIKSCQKEDIRLIADLLGATNKTRADINRNRNATEMNENMNIRNNHITTTQYTEIHKGKTIENKSDINKKTKSDYYKQFKRHHRANMKNIEPSRSLKSVEIEKAAASNGVLNVFKSFFGDFQRNKTEHEESQEIVDQIIKSLKPGSHYTDEIADIFEIMNIPTSVKYSNHKQDEPKVSRSKYFEDLLNELNTNEEEDTKKNSQIPVSTTPQMENNGDDIFVHAIKYLTS